MSPSSRTKIRHAREIFDACRAPLLAVLDGIQPEDLNWQPRPGMRGIGKIYRHVYRVDIWFLRRWGVEPVITEDGPGSADTIAVRMRTIQEQIIGELEACGSDEDLVIERRSLDGSSTSRLGHDVIHLAQHYMYHLAQVTYLRRLREPAWSADLDAWESATHLIEERVLGYPRSHRDTR